MKQAKAERVVRVASVASMLAGILAIAVAVAADRIGLGTGGFGTRQCMLMWAGLVILLLGLVLRKSRRIWRLTRTREWRVFSLLLSFVAVLALTGTLVLVGVTAGDKLH